MRPADSVDAYLTALAARSSTPGGGAVAAMSAAQGCALMSMVCRFTRGNSLDAVLERSDAARTQCVELAEADVQAFDAVMAAYRNKGEDRTDVLERALKQAAEIPMRLIELVSTLATDLETLESQGNTNLVTDTGIAAQQIRAAIDAARLNVLVNLKEVEDPAWRLAIQTRLDATAPVCESLGAIAARIEAALAR